MKSFVSIISCLTLIPAAVGDSLEAYHAKPFGIGRLTLSQPAKGARRTPLSTTRLADRLQRDRGSVMRYPVAERSGLVGEQEGAGLEWIRQVGRLRGRRRFPCWRQQRKR